MVCEAPFDRIEKVYMSERFATDNEDFVKKLGMSDDKVETVADNVFAHMSDTQTPQGVMAVINMKEYSVDDIIKAGSDRKPGSERNLHCPVSRCPGGRSSPFPAVTDCCLFLQGN